jgi:hypothetical protein
MYRFFSAITVTLFLVFLCIPPLINLLTPDQEISKTEKRRLAAFPKLEWNLDQVVEFPAKFEKYYNDHFGLRDLLVSYQQFISYKVFKVSSSPFVTVGKDNWLFFNGDAALDAYLGFIQVSRVHLETYQWVLKDRRDWLAEKGIGYVFVPVPNKESIYPEHIPWRIKQNAGTSLYDQIVFCLNEHPGFSNYIDLKEVFFRQKENELLYLKTDSHWNMKGAFTAYRKIGVKVKEQNIPMHLLKKEDVNWKTVTFSGDLATYLHLQDCINEIAPEINGINPCEGTLGEIKQNEQETSIFNKFNGDSRNFVRVQECAENETSALVIHDSFGNFLWPFLNRSFGTVYYVNRGFNEIKDFIEAIQPDVVIDQRVERNILKALEPDRALENEMAGKQFHQLKHNLLQIDKNSGSAEVVSSAEVKVLSVDDGLQIRSEKQYPALGFQYDPGESKGSVVVQIRLSSQQETQCLLNYTTKEKSVFIPSHTLGLDVKKGYNEFYFRLPEPGTKGKLQFHPGAAPGEYLLHSFVVKR